jgi:prolyl oligopeptidase PreP (S9A serine peptidase family)
VFYFSSLVTQVTGDLFRVNIYLAPSFGLHLLRDLKTDHNLLLLSTDMEAGHSGPSGRFQFIKEIALVFAFILDQLGITHQGDVGLHRDQ